MEYTVHQAKTHFSRLLEQAQAGETVVITKGREKTPIVRLVPVTASRIGWLKGIMPDIGDEIFDPMPEEELALWEDGPVFPES